MPPYEKDPLFVPSDIYVARICELFDYWMKDKDCNIGLSYFEHYMNYLFLQEKHLCSFNSRMGKFTGIRYDGSICACNRDFPKQYSFGNVYDYTYIRECFSSKEISVFNVITCIHQDLQGLLKIFLFCKDIVCIESRNGKYANFI